MLNIVDCWGQNLHTWYFLLICCCWNCCPQFLKPNINLFYSVSFSSISSDSLGHDWSRGEFLWWIFLIECYFSLCHHSVKIATLESHSSESGDLCSRLLYFTAGKLLSNITMVASVTQSRYRYLGAWHVTECRAPGPRHMSRVFCACQRVVGAGCCYTPDTRYCFMLSRVRTW